MHWSKDRNSRLRPSILRLHVIHVVGIILALVIVLRDAAEVTLARDGSRSKRRSPPQAVTLRISDVEIASPVPTHDAAVVRNAGASVLRDDRGSVAVCASLSSARAAGHARSEGSRSTEHRQPGRICRLRAERLNIRRNVTKCIVSAIKARIKATGSTRSASHCCWESAIS